MSLTRNINQVLALLNKAIKQTPLDKQPILAQKVNRVMDKYSKLNPEDNQPAYLRQLEFNLNFIRLSFPHLDYSPPIESEGNVEEKVAEQKVEEEPEREKYFELENKEQVYKFVEETAKALKGVRQQVQFSNWGTGNVDPQDLRRHQQLLKRQHFSGQFWKGKQKPGSPTAAYMMDLMQNHPQKRDEKIVLEGRPQPSMEEMANNPNWEKVKR